MPDPTEANPGPHNTDPRNHKTHSPATGPLTIKQQREAKRREKVEKAKRQEIKAQHNRRIGLIVGGIAIVVVIALVAVIVTTAKTSVPASIASINGVQIYPGVATKHVDGLVKYQQTPPVGGEHAAALLNCAIYASPVPNENAVHSLEHGAVWITYNPSIITGSSLATLRESIPKTFAILSPFQGLPSPIVASAWGAQLRMSQVGDPRIVQFLAKYRGAKSAPEPGAPCTGGIEGPGKVS
jgi:hypothetical protein